MTATLQFSAVNWGRMNPLTFVLEQGTVRVLHLASREEKVSVVDLALGERAPDAGSVRLEGGALDAAPPGSLGWVPENGDLIGNLKTWENVTLPLWYHRTRRVAETEAALSRWLAALGVPEGAMAAFMASPAARLNALERKRAGLLRGLLLAPRVLVVDAGLFSGVSLEEGTAWKAALDELAAGEAGSSVLVAAAPSDPALDWQTITTG
jgi:ABC-type transporter Mla maintaining outer membrane lipid asymmetry ATPase subunit MlaF